MQSDPRIRCVLRFKFRFFGYGLFVSWGFFLRILNYLCCFSELFYRSRFVFVCARISEKNLGNFAENLDDRKCKREGKFLVNG